MLKSNTKFILFIVFIAGFLITLPFNFVSGATCPSNTTASSTSANLVVNTSELSGGAANYLWFEYGINQSSGLSTLLQQVSQQGNYCAEIKNLLQCTTYYYKAVAQTNSGVIFSQQKSFTTNCTSPKVNLLANGSETPISVNSGASVTLSWTTEGANSCWATGDWTGTKALSGSQVISNITSNKTFTLSCSSSIGSIQDSVMVSLNNAGQGIITKLVSNLSSGTGFEDSVLAKPGDALAFSIEVRAGSAMLQNLILKDVLSDKLTLRSGSLQINGVLQSGDIMSGISIGDIAANSAKIITFITDVKSAVNFSLGQTQLTNTATAYNSQMSVSDSAIILVNKSAVAGAGTATEISTGWTNNIFADSLLLPLLFAAILTFVFKKHLFKFEEWYDKRRHEYAQYKSNKELDKKIEKAKISEILRGK